MNLSDPVRHERSYNYTLPFPQARKRTFMLSDQIWECEIDRLRATRIDCAHADTVKLRPKMAAFSSTLGVLIDVNNSRIFLTIIIIERDNHNTWMLQNARAKITWHNFSVPNVEKVKGATPLQQASNLYGADPNRNFNYHFAGIS